MRSAFESAGDIRSVDLLSALVALWREKADGSLEFSRPGATAGFGLRGGEIVTALSSQTQYETAAILTRAGKLDAAALEKLQRPAGGDASIAALQAGLITEREWRWGQKIRAIEILSDLLGWLEGDYSFGPQSRPTAGEWTLPVPRLVLELFLRSRDRTLIEHYLGPSDLPLLRAGTFGEEFETFGLTSDAGSVVALIDGRASAEEIAERAPAEEFAVLKLLAALTTLGLVHPAEGAPEPGSRTSSAIRLEGEEEETAPEAEPKVGVEPELDVKAEGPVESRTEEKIEPQAEEAAEEKDVPPVLVGKPPEKTEGEPALPPLQMEKTPPAAPESVEERSREAVPEPAIEPARLEPPRSEIPVPEGLEPSAGAAGQREIFEPEFQGAGEAPHDGGTWRPAVLLGGLLVVLVLAVVALVIVRSRRAAPEHPVGSNVRPTAQENPVFPRAETAVPLGVRATPAATPSPAVTNPAAVPPAPASTRAPRPTAPPTRVPTRPPPTRPPTQVPTRVPSRQPTKPPTPVATRPQPTRPSTGVPTKAQPTEPPTRLRPTAVPTATAAVGGEATRAEWVARAERERRALSKRRNVRYAVQLELACEIPTLEKAWNWDKPPGTIWLLTTPYRGRTCFRVLWGRFAGLPEAREAKGRVPDFFVAPGNRPTIVSVR